MVRLFSVCCACSFSKLKSSSCTFLSNWSGINPSDVTGIWWWICKTISKLTTEPIWLTSRQPEQDRDASVGAGRQQRDSMVGCMALATFFYHSINWRSACSRFLCNTEKSYRSWLINTTEFLKLLLNENEVGLLHHFAYGINFSLTSAWCIIWFMFCRLVWINRWIIRPGFTGCCAMLPLQKNWQRICSEGRWIIYFCNIKFNFCNWSRMYV